jgi:large subunit ribosomal protein L20
LAKGYRGGRSKLYRPAKDAVERAWAYGYRHRRNRKRDFRRLWITRINAAARQHDITYSHFMNGLRTAGVELNRKTLAEIAVRDPNVFGDLVTLAKDTLAG